MSKQNLETVKEEINSAIEIAKNADQSIDGISAVDADVFKQIARPLRRALRLVNNSSVKPSQDEEDANLLFDAMSVGDGNKGDPNFEFACVLDDEIDAANRVYSRRDFFTLFYLDAIKEGKSDELSFILRELRKGTDPREIAKRFDNGGLK
jgi:hypothetical protein